MEIKNTPVELDLDLETKEMIINLLNLDKAADELHALATENLINLGVYRAEKRYKITLKSQIKLSHYLRTIDDKSRQIESIWQNVIKSRDCDGYKGYTNLHFSWLIFSGSIDLILRI